MDTGFTVQQIKDLQALITAPKNDSDSDTDNEDAGQYLPRQQIGPGDIGPTTKKKTSSTESSKVEIKKGTSNSDIWNVSEVKEITNIPDEDPRETPEYEMKFRQAVGTEDIYLGMNMKTPATASCEWLTLLIKLPDESFKSVELNVESNVVDLRSPKYRLQLPTPFPVDPNSSTAKWYSDKSCLEITLKLTRELDDVNF